MITELNSHTRLHNSSTASFNEEGMVDNTAEATVLQQCWLQQTGHIAHSSQYTIQSWKPVIDVYR